MNWSRRNWMFYALTGGIFLSLISGCMRYLTHNRSDVLLEGIDIDQSLQVAEYELDRGKTGASLTVWAMRNQFFNESQAETVSNLYFNYVDSLRRFDVWHITWAVSDIYRLGSPSIRTVLDSAYKDASKRAQNTHRLANRMANSEKVYMGDAHSGGRAYARKHLVVPGNKKYLQSFDEFLESL